jgi:hypothetical protein
LTRGRLRFWLAALLLAGLAAEEALGYLLEE